MLHVWFLLFFSTFYCFLPRWDVFCVNEMLSTLIRTYLWKHIIVHVFLKEEMGMIFIQYDPIFSPCFSWPFEGILNAVTTNKTNWYYVDEKYFWNVRWSLKILNIIKVIFKRLKSFLSEKSLPPSKLEPWVIWILSQYYHHSGHSATRCWNIVD